MEPVVDPAFFLWGGAAGRAAKHTEPSASQQRTFMEVHLVVPCLQFTDTGMLNKCNLIII
jgi:hypothetical protein